MKRSRATGNSPFMSEASFLYVILFLFLFAFLVSCESNHSTSTAEETTAVVDSNLSTSEVTTKVTASEKKKTMG